MRILKRVSVLLIIIALVSCRATEEKPLEPMPDDFYFIYRVWDMTILDTKNSIIGSYTIYDYIHTHFYICEEDLQKIFNAVIRYDVLSLNNIHRHYAPGYGGMTPRPVYFDFIFHLNGQIYTVYFDISTVIYLTAYERGVVFEGMTMNEQMLNLWLFHGFIRNFIGNTDEFQSFPMPIF